MKVSVPPDDYSLLHQMSSQELRLPEQMVRWLIRQEALRRGLASDRQLGSTPTNNRHDATNLSGSSVTAVAKINP